MAVLIYAECDNGNYKKSSFEAISYGRDLARSDFVCLGFWYG